VIPVRDENPSSARPVVTNVLIVLNVVAFLLEWVLVQSQGPQVVFDHGLVPVRFLADPIAEAPTIVSSMFLHGGFEHLGGNMLFLYIFGDNVEDALGKRRFVFFYFLSGIVAAAAQMAINPGSSVPMVGASGAIAGILAAYLVLYPRAPIHVLNPILPLWLVFGVFFVLPAWVVVGEWFVWNLFHGVGSLSAPGMGGVAFFAHLGGFVAGLVSIKPLLAGRVRKPRAPWTQFRPQQRLDSRKDATGPFRDPWYPG
jgi:membrane associated rhomboid family serine protease